MSSTKKQTFTDTNRYFILLPGHLGRCFMAWRCGWKLPQLQLLELVWKYCAFICIYMHLNHGLSCSDWKSWKWCAVLVSNLTQGTWTCSSILDHPMVAWVKSYDRFMPEALLLCTGLLEITSGNQTWLAGKSPMNGGLIRKITDKWSIRTHKKLTVAHNFPYLSTAFAWGRKCPMAGHTYIIPCLSKWCHIIQPPSPFSNNSGHPGPGLGLGTALVADSRGSVPSAPLPTPPASHLPWSPGGTRGTEPLRLKRQVFCWMRRWRLGENMTLAMVNIYVHIYVHLVLSFTGPIW